MTVRKEQEYVLQQAARAQLLRGQIDRREFLTRSLVAGLGTGRRRRGGEGRHRHRPTRPTGR